MCADPKFPRGAFGKLGDEAIGHGHMVVGIMLKDLEALPIESVESVLCADPDESLFVLNDGRGHALRQARIRWKVLECDQRTQQALDVILPGEVDLRRGRGCGDGGWGCRGCRKGGGKPAAPGCQRAQQRQEGEPHDGDRFKAGSGAHVHFPPDSAIGVSCKLPGRAARFGDRFR